MKIALAQINTSMGAIESNVAKMNLYLEKASGLGADLTVFPELSVLGYPPKDLLEQEGFVEAGERSLEQLAKRHSRLRFIAGFAQKGEAAGKGIYNCAAYVENGRVAWVQRKRLLPTYDVFDEARYFDAGTESRIVDILGQKVGITVCEDIWTDPEFLGRKLYTSDPTADLKKAGAELMINISASPYHEGKEEVRLKLAQKLIRKHGVPIVICNLVGGNDDVLFDGGSLAVDAKGKLLTRAKVFEEDLVLVDFEKGEGEIRAWPESKDEFSVKALTMGLSNYVHKCGFKKVVIGLSGGIDSSLVALLAVEALGGENVVGVSMPSRFTSDMSREDAETTAKKLQISFLTIPIEATMKTYDETLADAFSGRSRDTTEENLQARIRGNLLMALSNKYGYLVLSTGNKSELAVGYCTQYGDMAGGLAVISDLSKGRVYELARYLNQKYRAIPDRVFDRPPTAELRPGQKDEDSLPSYSVLDPILEMYIEDRKSPESIVQAGYDPQTVKRVVRMVDQNEFKRKQAAPGLRISEKAFGAGRRMPIARGAA